MNESFCCIADTTWEALRKAKGLLSESPLMISVKKGHYMVIKVAAYVVMSLGVHTIFVLNQSPTCAICGGTKNRTNWGPPVLTLFHTNIFFIYTFSFKGKSTYVAK